MPAFQRLTADDRPNGDDNAEYCGDIHGLVTSMPWAVGVPQKYLYQVGMVGLRPRNDSDSVQPVTNVLPGGALVGPADSLMLDAKQAILDEQHRKSFRSCRRKVVGPKPYNNFMSL